MRRLYDSAEIQRLVAAGIDWERARIAKMLREWHGNGMCHTCGGGDEMADAIEKKEVVKVDNG